MGLIARNVKTGGNTTFTDEVAGGNTTAKAAEVDADFDTVYDTVNGNLDNANVAAGANLDGAKLADGTVTSAKIADGTLVNADINAAAAIAGTKLAAGAATNGLQTDAYAQVTDITAETEVASISITTRGGKVLLGGTYAMVSTGAGTDTIIVKLKRDGVPIAQWNWPQTREDPVQVAIPSPFYVDAPVAGTYTYSVTVDSLSNILAVTTSAFNQGTFFALEFS